MKSQKRDVLLILFYTIRGQVSTRITTIGFIYAYLLLASGLRILNAWTHCLVQTGTAKKRWNKKKFIAITGILMVSHWNKGNRLWMNALKWKEKIEFTDIPLVQPIVCLSHNWQICLKENVNSFFDKQAI